jgi:predicted nucleic acid-binding protein
LNIDYIAKKQVTDIKNFLKLINKQFEVVGATNAMIENALKIDNVDLEDNLQYIAAKKSNCDIVITNDKSFLIKEIVTLSSSAFVNKYL